MDQRAREQVEFFDELLAAYHRAEQRTGARQWSGKLGPHKILLRGAGALPLERLVPALAHWPGWTEQTPDLSVFIWDNVTSGTRLPLVLQSLLEALPEARFTCLDPRGSLKNLCGPRIRTVFRPGPCNILSVLDVERGQALYWLDDANRLPYWEVGSPLQTLLNLWGEENGLQYLHAAAVGGEQGALLLTGRGGSGKSTTALHCLLAGLGYLGDDYCLAGPGHLYSLYNTAKLVDLELFPEFADWVENRERAPEDKLLLNVARLRPGQMVLQAPLKAVVVPQVRPGASRLRPVRGAEALFALAPTTLLQLAGTHQSSLTRMKRLLDQVPAYVLEAGTRPAEIVGLLRGLL